MTEEKDFQKEAEIAIIGGGLVGSLLAIFMAKRGFNIDVYERRVDMRKEQISAGRSINLAISTRGLKAMHLAGLNDDVLAQAVPMRGRMMHSKTGELTYQPYGKSDDEYINSISRASLNQLLMSKAEATGAVRFHFQQNAKGLDIPSNAVAFVDESVEPSKNYSVKAAIVIGTDGSASKVRDDITSQYGYNCSESRLNYGYKELVIPAGAGGAFQMEKHALHIWPRGAYMLIALPNFDGSFTCTLFLPYEGANSFERLTTREEVEQFFNTEFADAVTLIPNVVDSFFANPTGHMDTVKAFPWNIDGRALLLGDAAHAIVPFFGQGANCGFEDLTILEECIDEHIARGGSLYIDHREKPALEPDADPSAGQQRRMNEGVFNWQMIFDDLVERRKPNCDAIADMAVENFTEMRDKVGDPKFLLGKGVEKLLEKEFGGAYRSRYSLVTFSNYPYKLALEAGVVCEEILSELCSNIERPDQVDLVIAKKLIDAKLTPLLLQYGVTSEAVAAR
ncbi:NAD(P)/FAD-dependent oxidoreductase [soil metagenome]